MREIEGGGGGRAEELSDGPSGSAKVRGLRTHGVIFYRFREVWLRFSIVGAHMYRIAVVGTILYEGRSGSSPVRVGAPVRLQLRMYFKYILT